MMLGFKVSYKVRKGVNSGLSLVLGLMIVLSFQNCADLDQANVVTVTEVEQQLLSNLPFAFDLKVDQMSYMSCSGQFGSDPRAYTIKAGGYFPGSGVTLRSNYASQISNLNVDTQVRSFGISERNDQAGVVMNIRPRSNLQDYVEPSEEGGEITSGQLMYNTQQGILLSNERVARQLLALGPGGYLNYVAGIPGLFNKSFDGVVRINTNSGVESQMRNLLRNTHYLTFTYPEDLSIQTDTAKPFRYVRSPYGTTSGDPLAVTNVFGTGYTLNFQQFDPRMTTTPSRIMTVQNAVNLENNSFYGESWDCNERFVIVRPEDATRLSVDIDNDSPAVTANDIAVCDTKSDDIPNNATEQLRWDRIRNILPAEDWYVNLPCPAVGAGPPGCIVGQARPGCIIPKGDNFCYDMNELTGGSNDENIKIAYYYEEYLDNADPVITYNGACGPGTFFVCPHFVTICHKR